jgi:hypothetical protein
MRERRKVNVRLIRRNDKAVLAITGRDCELCALVVSRPDHMLLYMQYIALCRDRMCVYLQVNAITGGLFTSDLMEAAANSKDVTCLDRHMYTSHDL